MVGFRIGFDMAKITGLLGLLSGADFREPLIQVGKRLERSTANNFKNQCDPDGIPWKPNFRQKIKGENSKGKKPLILINTGRLRNSVTSNVEQNVNTTSLEWGTNVEYAKLQQEGGPSDITILRKKNKLIRRGKNAGKFTTRKINGKAMGTYYNISIVVPPRPFLGISELDKVIIGRVFEDYYRKLLSL